MNEILKFTASKIKPCPSTLIIAPTQTILRLLREELAKFGQNLKQLQLIADCIPLHCSEKISVLGPIVGMEAINLTLAPLLEEKIEKIYFIGIAGSKNRSIGSIVQGTDFSKENGTCYSNKNKIENIELAKVLSIIDPYQNTNKEFDLIEMESAEIARLCLEYNKEFHCLFCISDSWKEGQWNSGFNSEVFSKNLKKAVQIICNKSLSK